MKTPQFLLSAFPSPRLLVSRLPILLSLLVFFSAFRFPPSAFAAPVPYAGKLAVNGLNYSGSAPFTFALRDANGTVHWRNGADANASINVPVDRGHYLVLLGGQGMNPLDENLFFDHPELHLQVRFYRADTQQWLHLLPDQRITSTPHALAANVAKLAEAVKPGAVTKDMLAPGVLEDLNATPLPGSVTRAMLSQAVLADLNRTITREMLPASVLSDLNATIPRSRLPQDVLADLNKTLTRADLPADVLADLNRTIARSDLPASVLADLNASVTLDKLAPEVTAKLEANATLSASSVTTAHLSETILKYLKPTLVSSPAQPQVMLPLSSLTLSGSAEGKYLGYQWKKNGQALPGETNATLVLSDLNATLHDGNYTLVASNDFGSVTTVPVSVEVNGTAAFRTVPSAANLEMIWVQPGSFTMGSPGTEASRGSDEVEHNVTLTQGFYLGKYEVTNAQWKAVMNTSPSQWTDDDGPVEKVSWTDAQSFCATLNQLEQAAGRLPQGWSYVLPTEAQWEYACRAGTTTAFSHGNSLSSTQANFKGTNPYGGGAVGPNLQRTTDVGSYAANPWGFHDMHGNVWEWCADWKGNYPTGAVTDPTGPASGSLRVKRGGSWSRDGHSLRSARRYGNSPGTRNDGIGFRLGFLVLGE